MENNFYAMLSRMKYIDRWALMRNTRAENLSEHSYEVAYVAHCLALIEKKRLGRDIDEGKVVLAALYHDVPEIITGDLPTPVKYYGSAIKSAYDEVESAAVSTLMKMLPEDLREEYIPFLCENNEEVKKLVKAADKISALIKCTEELKMGNSEFSSAKKATEKAIKSLDCKAADIFLKEFMPAYALTLDEQNIG